MTELFGPIIKSKKGLKNRLSFSFKNKGAVFEIYIMFNGAKSHNQLIEFFCHLYL